MQTYSLSMNMYYVIYTCAYVSADMCGMVQESFSKLMARPPTRQKLEANGTFLEGCLKKASWSASYSSTLPDFARTQTSFFCWT